MSVRLMARVFDESEARGNERLVLLAIADEADDDGSHAYPGYDRLALKCRVPKSTVRGAVDRLVERGELEVTRPEKRGRGHFTTYRVILQERAEIALSDVPEGAEKGGKGRERAGLVPLTSTNADTQYSVLSKEKTSFATTPRKPRKTNAPDSFPLTDALRAWAKDNAPNVKLEVETERFLDYNRARGIGYVIWEAAWRGWMSKAEGYLSAEKPKRRPITLVDAINEAR